MSTVAERSAGIPFGPSLRRAPKKRYRAPFAAALQSCALALAVFAGCASPSFPPVDLASAAWRTHSGQAIWKPDSSKPEIVGDLLVATDQSGNACLEFSKTFPIVSARLTTNSWQIDFPPQNRHFAAPGHPPARIGWLQLLCAANDRPIKPPWEILQKTEASMTLANARTGERIEVHF